MSLRLCLPWSPPPSTPCSSWRLTLVVLGAFPVMMASGAATSKFIMTDGKDASFADAGSVAVECMSNIRTVASFGLQKFMGRRFAVALGDGEKRSIKYVAGVVMLIVGCALHVH